MQLVGSLGCFLVIESRFTDDDGAPVVTERFNLIHRS